MPPSLPGVPQFPVEKEDHADVKSSPLVGIDEEARAQTFKNFQRRRDVT